MGSRDKSGKHKRRKESRRSKRDSSSSSSSDSEDEAQQQLRQQREAVGTLRRLLLSFPAVRKELREMLWTIDQGEAADVSGIPDPDIKEGIRKLLKLLGLRKGAKDVFSLPARADKTLQVVGFVFEESPQALQQAHDAAAQKAKQAADRSGKRGAGSAPLAPAPAGSAEPEGGLGKAGGEGGGAGTGADAQASGPQGEAKDVRGGGGEGAPKEGKGQGEHTQGGAHARPAAGDSAADGNGGPSGASEGLAGAAAAAAGDVEGAGGGGSDGIGAAPAPAKRVMGPAAPSAAMLAAAAAYMKDLEEDDEEAEGAGEPGAGPGPRYEDDDELVGPVPPELALELDAVPQDDREAEVFRILGVLREVALPDPSQGALAPKPGVAAPAPDAYKVLGVDTSTPSAEVKKRYMRLSLLIHPDKCKHKDAHEAFQAVAKAAKTLQDSSARQALDAQLEDAELRRMAVRAAAQQERERQWRVAKGLEDPVASAAAAAAALAASLPQKREAWMTELPAERVMPNKIEQISQRTFSRTGIKPRGDTSSWTDTPQQREARAAGLLPSEGPALLTVGAGPGIGPAFPSASASVLDHYNTQHRKKSLVEEHLERLARGETVQQPAKKADAAPAQRPGDADGGGERSGSGSSSSDGSSGSSSESDGGGGDGRRGDGTRKRRRERGEGDGRSDRKEGKRRKRKDKDKEKKKKRKSNKDSKDKRKDKKTRKAGVQKAAAPAVAAPPKEAWAGEHPWRPFDRDKDLEIKPKVTMDPSQLIRNAALMNSGRFQSAGGTRHFL